MEHLICGPCLKKEKLPAVELTHFDEAWPCCFCGEPVKHGVWASAAPVRSCPHTLDEEKSS